MVLNEYDFELKVLQSDKPVVVVFYSSLSGICKLVEGRCKDSIREYTDEIYYYRVEKNTNVELARTYRINELPTFLFYWEGSLIDSVSGFVSEEELRIRMKILLAMRDKENKQKRFCNEKKKVQ